MGTLNDNVKAQVKRPFFRNWQMAGRPTDIHVFGTKEEKLLFFQDMRHVIIRAIATGGQEEGGNPLRCFQAVHHGTESLEFIFEMDRLYHGIPISMGGKVIKGIEVDTVEAFCGMPFRNRILLRGPFGGREKGEVRAISGQEPVVRRSFQ